MLERAAKESKPLLLFFMDEGMTAVDATELLNGEDVAKLSKEKAIFVLMDYNPDRTPSLNTGSPVPTSKLTGPNPSRDYDIRSTPTWIVADWHGNEYKRLNKAPDARTLTREVESVSKTMEVLNSRLQKRLEDGRKALEKQDSAGFIKQVMQNFRDGWVGLPAQEESVKAYRELLDNTRTEIDTILKDRPADAQKRLKEMQRAYKGTEMDKEIKDALDILK